MKRLIMCEGPNELTIMNILLENDALIITEDDLIGLTPYHARQIRTSTQVRTALNLYPGNDVLIMRVGDKQSDRLTIPADYREKIIGIEKYCTMPELEILLIISEGLAKEYDKVKSTTSPKEFAKEHVRFNRKRYDNARQRAYWAAHREHLNALRRESDAKRKDEVNARQRAYRLEHREKINARRRELNAQRRDEINAQQRANAVKRKASAVQPASQRDDAVIKESGV